VKSLLTGVCEVRRWVKTYRGRGDVLTLLRWVGRESNCKKLGKKEKSRLRPNSLIIGGERRMSSWVPETQVGAGPDYTIFPDGGGKVARNEEELIRNELLTISAGENCHGRN